MARLCGIPTPILSKSGDSGSPLFAWDSTLNNWAVIPLDFVNDKITDALT
ncbi:S6 family peptidase [Escherichia coli]